MNDDLPANRVGDICSNFYDGAPFLRCSCPQALSMQQELLPTDARSALLNAPEMAVWVEWGSAVRWHGSCRLTIRLLGKEVSGVTGECSQPLSVKFGRHGACAGTSYLAELRWHGGSRWLHVLAPPTAGASLHGLVLPPLGAKPSTSISMAESATFDPVLCSPMDAWSLLSRIQSAEARAPPLPAHPATLARGFGLELEYLTEAARDAIGNSLKVAQMRAALHHLLEPTAGAPDGHASLEPLRSALRRCEAWTATIDPAILATPEGLAERMLEATEGLNTISDPRVRADARMRSLHMLLRRGAIMKSEFQSPSPPHELRFVADAALEIAAFVSGALASTGAAATSISAVGHSATAIHVHVNVRNPAAGGTLLSAVELLGVLFAWIRFDQVTLRFARSWMWSEPSCAPLLATGAEMGSLEDPWVYAGDVGMPSSGNSAAEGPRPATSASAVASDAPAEAPEMNPEMISDAEMRARYDVPSFVRAVWTVVHADGFEELSEQHKIGRLFGLSSPAEALTRQCSINLMAIRKHGTLEFRRFHGSLDATLIVRWAHFCVAFVECFRSRPWRLLSEHPSAEAALQALQTAQEEATADELMACMHGFVDPKLASHMASDAVR